MRTLIATLVFPAALIVAVPAAAQVYKWVDERGVTNYSNQPPASPGAGSAVRVVEDRVSVYTPDQPLLQAIEAERRTGASTRIAELERQLDAERRARQAAAAAGTPRWSDPCAIGGIDCSNFGGPVYTPVLVPARPTFFRPRPIRPAQPAPARFARMPSPTGTGPLLGVAPPSRPHAPRAGPWEWPR